MCLAGVLEERDRATCRVIEIYTNQRSETRNPNQLWRFSEGHNSLESEKKPKVLLFLYYSRKLDYSKGLLIIFDPALFVYSVDRTGDPGSNLVEGDFSAVYLDVRGLIILLEEK